MVILDHDSNCPCVNPLALQHMPCASALVCKAAIKASDYCYFRSSKELQMLGIEVLGALCGGECRVAWEAYCSEKPIDTVVNVEHLECFLKC